MSLQKRLVSPIWNKWYNYITKLDSKGDVLFLNYGYKNNETLKLKKEDEKNRYGIHLYHKVVSSVEINNKKILEIGCGKGGGASYIARYMKPKIVVGMDKSKNQIEFNKKYYLEGNLRFKHGDALKIPISNESFDILVNVESSHCYANFDKFLKEVKRVLRTKGYFLFADFRKKELIKPLLKSIDKSGLQIKKYECITENVVEALKIDDDRRTKLLKRLLPKIFHKWGRRFAGVRGSKTYNSFKNGKNKYFYFVLQKV
ncbi:MAG: methyltransferase domain-containing protein [Nanoarchaeota archaeon]